MSAWPKWLAVVAWNLAGAVALFLALAESRRWPEPPETRLQGERLDASVARARPTAPRQAPADGVLDLSWFLIPGYDPPELRPNPAPLPRSAFPESVQALHGSRIRLRGYVLALTSGGPVQEFLLNRYPPGCCFGARPALDEWILVSVSEGFDPGGPGDRIVEVEGVLEVGELQDAEGFALSLYRIEAESVDG